jgi:hypothetical protein
LTVVSTPLRSARPRPDHDRQAGRSYATAVSDVRRGVTELAVLAGESNQHRHAPLEANPKSYPTRADRLKAAASRHVAQLPPKCRMT